MSYTVEYPTTGQIGCQITTVINRSGHFSTKAEAEAYLQRAPIPGGVVVPSANA